MNVNAIRATGTDDQWLLDRFTFKRPTYNELKQDAKVVKVQKKYDKELDVSS